VTAAIITQQRDLDAFCERLRRADRIAFDTEFVSEFTYKPELCLIQVGTADEAWCIDTLAPLDLSTLWEILTDPKHQVIAHAARQELLFAIDATGKRLARLCDVQLAAGMIGMEYPAGYGNLVSRLLGETPQKGETRTDWRRRPLTERQIVYALADVQHLLPLHDVLTKRLADLKRSEWFASEMEVFQADIEGSLTRERWRRTTGGAGLPSRGQAVLRELWLWRERESEQRNLPPRLVLRDDLLVEMAKRRDADPKHLGAIRGMERPEIRRAIPEFAAAIDRALKLPDSECPPVVRTDTNSHLTLLGTFLSAALGSLCRAAEIAPSLVGTPNDVRELVNYRLNGVLDPDGLVPTLARGWRAEVVGHHIEELLMGRASIRIIDAHSEHPLVIEEQQEIVRAESADRLFTNLAKTGGR
jgi:ribonuclease D